MKKSRDEVVVVVQTKIQRCRKNASCIMRALVETVAVDFHGVSPVPKNGESLPAGHETYSVKAFDSDPDACSYEFALFIKEDMKSMQTVIEGRKIYHDLLSVVDQDSEPVIMAMIDWRDSTLIWKDVGVWLLHPPFAVQVISNINLFEVQLDLAALEMDLGLAKIKIFPVFDDDLYSERRDYEERAGAEA